MPFAAEFDDVFLVAMTHAAESIGATCKRVDHEDFSGDIVQEIKSLIQQSAAVIVDLTGARPNVLYELGYAEGLGKPIVNICSSPLAALPFDVRNWNVLAYTAGQTYKLREPLARRLQAVVAKAHQS
jgi:nucleoside 2-deoxyribosyltransferase